MTRLAAAVLLALGGCQTVNPYSEITQHREAACVAEPYQRLDARIDWEDPRPVVPLVEEPGVILISGPQDYDWWNPGGH